MDTWWLQKILCLQAQGVACVLVSVVNVLGSAPREIGTRMIVSSDTQWGTIGGGNLEYEITKRARQILKDKCNLAVVSDMSLGAKLGQCCGGRVQVLMEPVNSKPKLVVFGAGHVGKELVDIAAELPINIDWIDERQEQFPNKSYQNVKQIIPIDSTLVLEDLEGHEAVVILTHNHALDLSLCESLMRLKHRAYIGLIGSRTKWKRFENQLLQRDFSPELVSQIQCPVGVRGVASKNPRAIAISILAQLLQNIQLPGESADSSKS